MIKNEDHQLENDTDKDNCDDSGDIPGHEEIAVTDIMSEVDDANGNEENDHVMNHQ